MPRSARTAVGVCLEAGRRRVFASALDWPGWCRSGRDEDGALSALADYATRFAPVAAAAGHPLAAGPHELVVVERLSGSSSTDFGVPGAVAAAEREPADPATGERLAAFVAAAWAALDAVAAAAPATLRKGPRGGGRDRDAIAAHVAEANAIYARKLGLRVPVPPATDRRASAAWRQSLLGRLRAGEPGAAPGARGWPVRYAARRLAWHALDHAWEIEDRRQ